MPTAVLNPLRESGLLIKANPDGGSFTDGGAQFFHVAEGWDLDLGNDYFDVMHNGNNIGSRIKSKLPKLTGTPVGEYEHLTTLFPNLTANLGARLNGATDAAWKFITPSGRQWLIPRGVITKRPMLSPVVGKTLLGEIELTMLYSPTAGNHYTYTEEETHPGFASLDSAQIITLNPAVSFGSGNMDEMHPVAGCEIEFGWDLVEVRSGMQIVDYTIGAQNINAKCAPQNDAAFDDWITKIGADLAPGSALPVTNFIASYNGFYVQLYNCECRVEKFKFHHKENFVTGITANTRQRYSGGAAQPLAYVNTSD